MLAPGSERIGSHWVSIHERAHQGSIRKIGEHGPVPGEEQLTGVIALESTGIHFSFEEANAPVEERPQCNTEFIGNSGTALERFPASDADEFGVLFEELECSAQDPLDLGPAGTVGRLDGDLDEFDPVGERVQDHLSVELFLGWEVVEEALAADADLVGNVVEARAGKTVLSETALSYGEDGFPGARGYYGLNHLLRLFLNVRGLLR